MKTIAISLALGDIYSTAGTGFINQPLDGAIARFNTITDEVSCNKDTFVICTAGYSKKFPRIPQPERQVSLADQLGRYVRENKPEWIPCLVTKPLCWSARNEIRTGIKLAQRQGFANKEEGNVLIVTSNLAHLVRIWLYVILYTPKNWKIKMLPVRHYFSLYSHILEPVKIMRDIMYTVRVLYRLHRFKK